MGRLKTSVGLLKALKSRLLGLLGATAFLTVTAAGPAFAGSGGLGSLQKTVVTDWIGPAFLIAIAIFAAMLMRDRAWMKVLGLVAIGAVVGLLIYDGATLFGGSSGSLVKIGDHAASQIGTGGSTVSGEIQQPGASGN